MDQSNSTNALPTSLRILCFGDSLTAGYTMSGWSFFPYATELRVHLMRLLSLPESMITIEVEGLSGDQVRAQYQRRMQRKCASATNDPYDWIVIMGGTNDLGWGEKPDQVYEGLQKVWRIALDTGANVLALNVIEAAGSSSGLVERRNALNTMIANHVDDRFYTLDLWSAIRYTTIDEDEQERIWDDGLHLTQAGYKMMADAIAIRLFELVRTYPNPKNQKIGCDGV